MRNSQRRRRERPRPSVIVLGGLVTLAILAVLIRVAISTPGGAPGVDYRTLYATVPDIGNLRKHQEVRIAGVNVGQVLDAKTSGDQVRLELQLKPKTSALSPDTTVAVRAAGLLGARYVELRPGNARGELRDGAEIRSRGDALSSGVSDALETFDEETRGAMGETIRELGTGVLGRGGQLNDMFDGSAKAAEDFQTGVNAVLDRPGAVDRLVPSLADAAEAVDAAREDFGRGVAPLATVVEAMADRRDALGQTLELAPPTLAAARPALTEGRQLLRATGSLARSVTSTLPPAPAALRTTAAALRESRVPLARGEALLRAAGPAVAPTLGLTGRLKPVLTPLRETLADLREPVRLLGRHGCDVGNIAENWRSVLGYGTTGGAAFGPYNTFRIEAVAGPESVSQFNAPTPDALIDRDPYPAPCVEDGGKYDVLDLTGIFGGGGR